MPSSPISPCPSCPPHAAGGHGCAVYWSSVTEAQWAILEPLLPAPGSTAGRGGRPEKHCQRRMAVGPRLPSRRGGSDPDATRGGPPADQSAAWLLAAAVPVRESPPLLTGQG